MDPAICEEVCQNPAGCSNIAYPRLVLGIMPEGLRGVMISVMLAALMSDLTSIFNSASTLFTMDVYRRARGGRAGTRELLVVGRVCILLLVAASILWIPLIQGLNNGQLFVYIQAVSAYLSPPIAMVFCMAICWKRMNEAGAFWGLMVGLAIGIVRMVLDFAFPDPGCTEFDGRPGFVVESKFHYMYFAAFLFWTTGVVCFIVSLLTKAGDDYRLIRTTVQTRFSREERPDEKSDGVRAGGDDSAQVEMKPLTGGEEGAASADEKKVEIKPSSSFTDRLKG